MDGQGPPTIQVCHNPKDDMVLALALGGRADVIVSGDKDLLSLSPHRGIPILTPREFLTMVREHDR
jgi:predicted nucleic acid-binding protein